MQVVDDAVAFLHDDGAELDGLHAQGQEVRGGLVVHGAAVAADVHAHPGDVGQGQVADLRDALAGQADDDALLPGLSSRPCRKAMLGKVFASVTPAFLCGYLAKTSWMAAMIG